MQLEEDVQ
ncbi:hypothetical protein KIPB_017139, partial [Kipferlia bialata]|eukprot:g17139.t1